MAALSLASRDARPFGVAAWLHWAGSQVLLRYGGSVELAPDWTVPLVYVAYLPRDVLMGALLLPMVARDARIWKLGVLSCYAGMSMFHVAYWCALASGVYMGVEYMTCLNALMVALLLFIGVAGGPDATRVVRRGVRRVVGPYVGRRDRGRSTPASARSEGLGS